MKGDKNGELEKPLPVTLDPGLRRGVFATRYHGRRRLVTVVVGETRTDQGAARDCDINTVLEKYLKRGIKPPGQESVFYGDVSDRLDFKDSLDFIRKAQADFLEIDPRIRARFGHDPQKLLEFLSKEENRDEAEELGLVEKKKNFRSRDELDADKLARLEQADREKIRRDFEKSKKNLEKIEKKLDNPSNTD